MRQILLGRIRFCMNWPYSITPSDVIKIAMKNRQTYKELVFYNRMNRLPLWRQPGNIVRKYWILYTKLLWTFSFYKFIKREIYYGTIGAFSSKVLNSNFKLSKNQLHQSILSYLCSERRNTWRTFFGEWLQAIVISFWDMLSGNQTIIKRQNKPQILYL